MPTLNTTQLQAAIKQLENQRHSRVLVLAATHLDLDLLPYLYNELRRIGAVRKLDLVLQSRGGEVNAVRRIAMLLRSYCENLHVLVPYYCQSAATLLALAADDIVAGELAMFSPIDPHLHGAADGTAESAISYLDICKFKEMASEWFGIRSDAEQSSLLAALCEQLFPPTLTAFYRANAEVQSIAEQLLQWQLPAVPKEKRTAMIQQLLGGYHSHHFALSGPELHAIGFKVRTERETEPLLWEISTLLRDVVGIRATDTGDGRWLDAVLLSNDAASLKLQHAENARPVWVQEVG